MTQEDIVIQFHSEITNLWARCGQHTLGSFQCENCKAKGPKEFCGKLFVYSRTRSIPQDIQNKAELIIRERYTKCSG